MQYLRSIRTIIPLVAICLTPAAAQKLNWEKTTAAGGGMIPSIVTKQNGIVVAAVYQKGIIRSTDRGITWSPANSGLANSNVTSVAAGDGEIIYAATDGGGVFRSSDNGATWSAMNQGLTSLSVDMVASAPGGLVVAGTSRGVFIHNGTSWEATAMTKQVWTIALSPDGKIFASTPADGSFRSTDFGVTWEKMSSLTAPGIMAIMAVTENVILAASSSLYASADGGATWKPTTFSASIITSIATTSYGWIMVATDAGIFRSADNGTTWHQASEGFSPMSLSSGADPIIYAGTSSGAIYRGTLGNSSVAQWSGSGASSWLRHAPNPVRESMQISFTLPSADHVRIVLCDLSGREIEQIASEPMERGEHRISWNMPLPSGTYILRLEHNGATEHRLISVVR